MIQPNMFPEAEVPKVDENRRYTTRAFMHFIKRAAKVSNWDLDPAADLESHHADRWFCAPGDLPTDPEARRAWVGAGCVEEDGLRFSWLPVESETQALIDAGDFYRIFINPPFDNIGPWLAEVWGTIAVANARGLEVRIAFVMPGNRTEQPMWQDFVEPFLEGHDHARNAGYSLVAHSPRTRQFYGHPGNPEPKSGQAEWPSVVLVWRRA